MARAPGSPAAADEASWDAGRRAAASGTRSGDRVAPVEVGWRPAFRAHAGATLAALPVVAVDGRLLIAGVDGCVSAYSREGRFLWAFWAEGPVVGTLAAARDGTVYVTTAAGHVQALRADGTELWRRTIPATALGAALLSGGRVVVAGGDGALHSVTGGSLVWRRKLARRLATWPVVAGRERVVVGDAEGALHVVTGGAVRTERLGGRFRQEPVSGAEGSVGVVLDDDLVVLDAALRERFTRRGVRFAGAAGDGWLAAAADGTVVWLDAGGEERARSRLPGAPSAAPLASGDRAFVPLESGALSAIGRAGSAFTRTARVGGAPLLAPVGAPDGASVVAASTGGEVVRLALE